MKKYIYIALALFSIATVHGQRLVPGQNGIELSAGSIPGYQTLDNYTLNAGLTRTIKGGNYLFFMAEYSRKAYAYESRKLPLECYLLEAGYSHVLFGSYAKRLIFYTGLSATGGYETINGGKSHLWDGAGLPASGGIVYGAGGRLSLEFHLTDWLVLLAQAHAKLLWNTEYDQLRPSAGIGIRLTL